MRAIVNATGWSSALEAVGERLPSGLLHLLDRPFLQHVVEYLISQGVKELDFLLWMAPEKIEALLGDGSRWGCVCRFHLVRDHRNPHALLARLLPEDAEPCLLAQGDTLPLCDLAGLENETAGVEFLAPDGQASGWAWLARPRADLLALDGEVSPEGADKPRPQARTCPEMLACRDHGQLLEAQAAVLEKRFPLPLLGGREIEPGIWLSRNVILHPTARLVPPVYIGADCRINQGAQVGPNVALGQGCVLDNRCALTRVVVFPGSYIGQDLELSEALVDRNRLVSMSLGTSMELTDDFLLGSLTDSPVRRGVRSALGRLVASMLLTMASPLMLAVIAWLHWRRRGPVVHRRRVVRQPALSEPTLWKEYDLISLTPHARPLHHAGVGDLVLRVLPGLWNVIHGDLGLVGLRPRGAEELHNLPAEHLSLCFQAKAGLIDEATAMFGSGGDQEQTYIAEAYYVAMGTLRHDLRIMGLYLRRLFYRHESSGPGE